jgi:hypothetical protein
MSDERGVYRDMRENTLDKKPYHAYDGIGI